MKPSMWKRIFDLAIAALGLTMLSPLLLVTALLIGVTMGRPVVFRQIRPGLKGKPFESYKFRTMLDLRDEKGFPLPDEQRLTRVGQLLRSSSLDELPQLFNVLRGDMSLVGPRPLLMEYLDRYTPEQARRLEVRPGITGWAQINGRNALSWGQKFELDVWYVDHWSLWLDLRIILKTVGRVLRQDDISAPGHATMPEFKGERENPDAE